MIDFILADTTHYAMLKGLQQVSKQSEQNLFTSCIVIVPDSKTIMAENYLLSLSKTGAFSNVHIYSLKRLLNKISPINNSLVLTKTAGTMIVRKIILENIDNLVCFKKTANTNGFAEIIYGTICQLKSSNISVTDFYNMIDGVKPALKIKMQDIALIYDQYQQYIENNYIDQSDLLTILKESASSSNFIKESFIYYLGFESVTAEGISTIKELIRNCKGFTVSASYMAETLNSHIADNEVFNKFKAIADELKYQYSPKKYNQPFNGDFLHIKNNMYAYPAKIKKGTNAVEILEATSKLTEVDFVAQKISALIKGGARYKDIAVIVNGIEEYKTPIEQTFKSFGFSYFISEPYDYSLHPLFRLIKSYIEVVRKNYDATDCIEFLSNILINSTNSLEDFINYVNKYGINHLKFTKPFTMYDEKTITQEQLQAIEGLRVALVNKVNLFKKEKSTVADYISAINNMLAELNITGRLKSLEESLNSDKVFQNITAQVKTKLDNVLSQMQTFLGGSVVSLEMFENILLGGLSVTDVSLVPVSQDAIIVSPSADGLLDIKYLFVVNATEGNFPVKQQDCGIIGDAEIQELNNIGTNSIEPTIKTINRRERYKAYETLLLPECKLVLSYNNGSGENLLKASNIIDQLDNMFGGIAAQKYVSEFDISLDNLKADVQTKLCTPNKVVKYVCDQVGEKLMYGNYSNASLASAAYNSGKKYMPYNLKQALDNINTPQDYTVKNGDKLYFNNSKTSTSQLEKYFTCPFLFFANYGLRLKENESSKLKALDVGNILHKLAEVFMYKLMSNNSLNVNLAAKNIINDILAKEYVVEDNKFLIKIIQEEAIRLCNRLADEYFHSHFKPIGLEKTFGAGQSIGAVKLTDSISLEGKIDRIDKYNDRFRIIDYKTGKVEDNIKRVFYGKKIQLVTYLLAMQNSGLKPAGVVYFPIRNEFNSASSKIKGFFISDANILMSMDTTLGENKLVSDQLDVKLNKPKNGEFNLRASSNLLTGSQFAGLADYVQKMCKNAVAEILQGYAQPSPIRLTDSDNLPCENCPYKGVCGVEKTEYAFGRKCYTDVKIENIMSIGGQDD